MFASSEVKSFQYRLVKALGNESLSLMVTDSLTEIGDWPFFMLNRSPCILSSVHDLSGHHGQPSQSGPPGQSGHQGKSGHPVHAVSPLSLVIQ